MFIKLTAIDAEDAASLSAPVWIDPKRIMAMVLPPAVKGKQFTILILEQGIRYSVLEAPKQIIQTMNVMCKCPDEVEQQCQSGIISKDSTGDTKTLT